MRYMPTTKQLAFGDVLPTWCFAAATAATYYSGSGGDNDDVTDIIYSSQKRRPWPGSPDTSNVLAAFIYTTDQRRCRRTGNNA